MSVQLAHIIAARLNMQPALIAPAHAEALVSNLRTLASANAEQEEKQQEQARNNLLSAYGYGPSSSEKPFIYSDGIAFIPITGMLVNRFNASWGWITGYNFIRSWINAALDDTDVKAIVLDCNSYGGEVAGCFELAADIRAARDVKPILAVVDAHSYSACYALASAASEIVATPSGGVGSIGVVAMHIDMSKWLSEIGIKVTFIHSGEHKVDGNPYEPLPASVRKQIQARVDNTRQEFVTLVAENRGLDAKVVFDTEAACFTAEEALELGLINAIAKPLEAVQAFLNGLSARNDQEITMSQATPKKEPGAEAETAAAPAAAAPAAPTQASTATTTPEASAPAAAAPVADAADARQAERDRIKAITGHESAKGRANLANHLAMNTNLSVEDAAKILAASPTEAAQAAGKSPFEVAMDAGEHPRVGADTAASGEEMTPAKRILAAQALATGASTATKQ